MIHFLLGTRFQLSFVYLKLLDQICVSKSGEGNQWNRPFPSSKKSHFQNEAKCETFVVKMSFICIIIKNHFHINGFALSLALKVWFFGTRKWPIAGAVVDHGNLVVLCAILEAFVSFLPCQASCEVQRWLFSPSFTSTKILLLLVSMICILLILQLLFCKKANCFTPLIAIYFIAQFLPLHVLITHWQRKLFD